MRYLLSIVMWSVLCGLASCGSEYWVPGLTLPAGSSVTSKSETTNIEGMMAQLPMMGEVDKVLNVSFDCPAGWAAASAHIDGCMKGQGYTDQMASMSQMMGGASGGADAAAMFSSMRMYQKQDGKFMVTLMDMGGAMQAASKVSGKAMPAGALPPGMSGFMLSIVRFK